MSTVAHFSLADYDRMIQCGAFDGNKPRRIELIRGEIREMTPIGPMHEVAVSRLDDWSHETLPKNKVCIRVQSSIGLPGLESVPQPDVAWVVRRDYSKHRPTAADVLLVIEVAESSLAYDRGEKADLYAAAGIADYWIVDLQGRTIEVRRDPAGGRYRTLRSCAGDDHVYPLAFPDIALRPAMLWSEASL